MVWVIISKTIHVAEHNCTNSTENSTICIKFMLVIVVFNAYLKQ